MRARRWTLVVRTRIWLPVKERAGTPRSHSAIASRAIDTCSPVDNNTSISRGVRLARDAGGEIDQPVGVIPHCGDHDGDAISLFAYRRDLFGDALDQLDRADGGAAVFLNDQRHDEG